MGIKERRERERQARLDTVLRATRTLVRERGFAGATTKSIAEQCELSEATLFHYFKSKDEIFTSLLFEGIEYMSEGLEEILSSNDSAHDRLARLWQFFSEVRRQHPEYFQIFAYLAHPRSTSAVTDQVKEEAARHSGDNFRRLAMGLREVVPESDGRIAADLLWATFFGLMVLRDSRTNLGAMPHPTEQDLAGAFALLLAGIAPAGNPGEEP